MRDPTHESYSHLSRIECDAVKRLSSTIWQEAVGALLSALGPDGQHAFIAKFIQNELDAEREEVILLHQQGSQQTELLREHSAQQTELLREHSAQQFELLRQQQATATRYTCIRRPKTLKIDISKFREPMKTHC